MESLKNKLIFPLGLIIATIGNITFNFATNLYLLEKTEKGIILATNVAFSILPLVITAPFLGKLIDKIVHKKYLIILANTLNLLLMLILFFSWEKFNMLYLIYSGILLNNFFSFLVYLTFEASIPLLFSQNWLIKANSIYSTLNSVCGVLAPIIGGFLYSFLKIQSILILNIFCLFIVIITNFFLTFSNKNIEESEKTLESTADKSNDLLKLIVVTGIIFNIGYGLTFSVTIPYLINKVFQIDSKIFGIIQSCFYIGMIFGASLFALRVKNIALSYFSKIFYKLGGIFLLFSLPIFISLDLKFTTAIYIVAMLLFGIQASFFDVGLTSFIQKEIPQNLLGKYLGIFISSSKLFFLLSIFISGIIIDYLSYKSIFLIGASLFVITALLISIIAKKRLP